MIDARQNPGDSEPPFDGPDSIPAGPTNRLNLLLSHAPWQRDSWADRLPRLLEPLGIRSLRVACGREASDVIKTTSVHIAVVDLSLPLDMCPTAAAPHEEAGARVLDLLARLALPPPTVVIKRSRTHRDDSREIAAALRAGAFAVIDSPREPSDLEILLEVLRRCLRRHYQGRWPGTA